MNIVPFSAVKTSKLRRNSPRHRDHSIEKFATLTEFGSNEDAPQATSLAKNSGENWNGIVQSDCSKFWRICCCWFQVRPKMALQLSKVKPNQILGNSSCWVNTSVFFLKKSPNWSSITNNGESGVCQGTWSSSRNKWYISTKWADTSWNETTWEYTPLGM